MTRVLTLLVLIFSGLHPVLGSVFYVSTTGSDIALGTQASPFLTIQHGVNQLGSGDDLYILAGTYIETVAIQNLNGTVTDDILIKGIGDVIIDGTGLSPSGRQGLLTISGCSYVTVANLELQNFQTNGGDTPVGILVEGSCTNISVIGNKVHDIKNLSTCSDCAEGAHGIAVYGTTAAGITDIILSYNEVYNNILQASESFVVNGNVSDFYVISNYVHDNNNIGFDFIGYEDECSGCGENDRARHGVVSRNTSTNNSSINNPWYDSADGTAGGFYVDGGHYILFESNVANGNDIGFEFASEMPGKKTENIIMVNNIVYNNIEAGVKLGGYSANANGAGGGSSENIHIYNNSFYQNKGWGSEIVFDQRVIDCNIGNNIFYGESSVGDNYENFGTGHTGNIWGKNIWWGTSTGDQSNLEGTLVIADPLYTNSATGDFTITSTSPAIDQGVLAANITDWAVAFWGSSINVHRTSDQEGDDRIDAIIDIGADESNVSTNDPIELSACISFYPGLLDEVMTMTGTIDQYSVSLYDQDEVLLHTIPTAASKLVIDRQSLGSTFHFVVIQHLTEAGLSYYGVLQD